MKKVHNRIIIYIGASVQEEKKIDDRNRSKVQSKPLRLNSGISQKENPVFLTRLTFGLLVTDITFTDYL